MLLLLLLLLLLATTRRGTSCSPPASSGYRHPMVAVRVMDDLFATPLLLLLLLLLYSLWRLSTKSNVTTENDHTLHQLRCWLDYYYYAAAAAAAAAHNDSAWHFLFSARQQRVPSADGSGTCYG